MAEDRRGTYRRNAFTFGAIEAAGGEIGCLVWDATDAGAQIEVEEPAVLPDRFGLRLSEGGTARPVIVAWRRTRRVGVTFEG